MLEHKDFALDNWCKFPSTPASTKGPVYCFSDQRLCASMNGVTGARGMWDERVSRCKKSRMPGVVKCAPQVHHIRLQTTSSSFGREVLRHHLFAGLTMLPRDIWIIVNTHRVDNSRFVHSSTSQMHMCLKEAVQSSEVAAHKREERIILGK